MKSILFVNPEDEYVEHKGDRLPLGLALLDAYCKRLGHNSKLIDLNHYSAEYLMDELKKGYGYVCFSVSTPNYLQCINLSKRIKSIYHNIKLIAGGNHITDVPNEKSSLETYDYLVVGDGEEAIKKILEDNTTQIIISKPIEDLDNLPFPDYEKLGMEKYTMTLNGKKAVVMVTSRGCVFSCVYCGSAKIKKWRARSPEDVVKEMKLLYDRFDIKGFYFGDDIFTFNFDRIFKLCNLISENFPKKDITWRCTTRANLLTQELCYSMRNAGCDIISLGLESGNNEVLKKMEKFMTTDIQKKGVEMCHKAGIKVKGFFIIGLPGETWETAIDTIEFARSLNLEYADAYILTPFPATPLWENPEKYGIQIIKPEGSDWSKYYQVGKGGEYFVNIKHNNLNEEQLRALIKKFRDEVKVGGLTYK
ncbi:radical SAM protein [Candidatus Woesearchaeota archaeon]|nr:radical SAM protein [Candidatus Woesearchaeota archaeon]